MSDTRTRFRERPGKANFNHIYDRETPRDYYVQLTEHDYQLPNHVQSAFGRLVEERARRDGRPPRIFDVACSYGVNAALLKYDVTFAGLAERYRRDDLRHMSVDELIEADRAYFAERARPDAPRVYGCDVAGNAVRYGERTGLLDRGWGVNLEEEMPDEALRECLARVDVVTVSAAIGYLTRRTIERIFTHIPEERRPWFAAFSLRTAPIDDVAHALHDHGLELGTLTGRTVRQRRFVNHDEESSAIRRVSERGYVVDDHESDGYWHAALYIGMPQADAPLNMVHLLDS